MRVGELLAVAVLVACSPSAGRATAPPGAPLTQPVSGDPHMNLDKLLQQASGGAFASYDPGPVIAAVNALVAAGHDGALASLDAYVAGHDLARDPQQGLFLVLRVAFEASPHPPMLLGGSQPSAPASPAALPRFPIMLVDDVPVMLVAGYTLRGLPEQVTAHLAYYRAHGTLRTAPLAPAVSADRLADYDAQYRAAYGAPPPDGERAFVRDQLARLKL